MIERGEEDFVPERDGREAGLVGKIRGLGSGRDDAALPHDTWESTSLCLRLHCTHLHPVHLDRCIAQGATLLLNFSTEHFEERLASHAGVQVLIAGQGVQFSEVAAH